MPKFEKEAPLQKMSANGNTSDQALVVESSHSRLIYAADGTGVFERSVVMRVQSVAGVQQVGVLSFTYASGNESVELLRLMVRHQDGTQVETPTAAAQDLASPVTREAPFYSDLREKQVPVKGLRPGDTLDYAVRYNMTKAVAPGNFWYSYNFLNDATVLDEQFELRVPEAKYVKVVSTKTQPVVSAADGMRVYTFKTSNVVTAVKKDDSPDMGKPGNSKQADVQITSFRNWEEVGVWYASLQKDRTSATPALRAKADELTKGLKTDDEKIRAIYDYVSTQFRYIGVAFGIGRYQPHTADEVLADQYGDCKDKHTLFAALLKAAGYDAWPVLISSTKALDPSAPSPGQFDHLITRVVLPTKQAGGSSTLAWADTTPGSAPYSALSVNLRDKQALVIPDNAAARLEQTPADLPFAADQDFSAVAKLNQEGTLTGHIEFSVRGDNEMLYRAAFQQTARSDWEKLAQNISYAMGYAGTVSNVDAGDPNDLDRPFHYSYDYERKNFGDWPNLRILAPLPYMGFPTTNDDKRPDGDVYIGSKGTIHLHSVLELPPGYAVQTLVDQKRMISEVEYRSTYLASGGKLTSDRIEVVKKPLIPLSHWDDYKSMVKAATDEYSDMMQLSNSTPGTSVPAEVSAAETGDPPDAASLVGDAYLALQNDDMASVQKYLRKAEALSAGQVGLWSVKGLVALHEGKLQEGFAAMQKEIDLHPATPAGYLQMAASQQAYGRRADELETLRKLLAIDPGNAEGAKQAAGLLLPRGESAANKEAEGILQKAVELNVQDPQLLVLVAKALLANGKPEVAELYLRQAIASEPDAATRNEATLILAEGKHDLPGLLENALGQLRVLEGTASSANIADLDGEDLRRMGDIAGSWGAVGWIYFNLGDLEHAKTYTKAAWLLGQGAGDAVRLGRIEEAMGNYAEAARMYRLATMLPRSPALAQKRLKALEVKGFAGHETTPGRLGDGLIQARSIEFPYQGDGFASADFWVLFENRKPTQFQFISGAESLRNRPSDKLLERLDVVFPDNGPEKLVRRGVLACSATTGRCQFILSTQ